MNDVLIPNLDTGSTPVSSISPLRQFFVTLSLEKTTHDPLVLQCHDATWQDYVAVRDHPDLNWRKIAFHQHWLWVDMGHEGMGHSGTNDLITALFAFWAFLHPEGVLQSYGGCVLEKPETHSCAPDLVLYKGEPIPRWQPGEPRRILLDRHRLPDLVGEVADTTLGIDLDEQKHLYASLGIAEYWVIDVKGLRIFAFGLTDKGLYAEICISQVLPGLAIDLVEQTLERSQQETNTAAASWFMQRSQTTLG
jgi:Uma2 family endonuclease